jgi:hypothetical protein
MQHDFRSCPGMLQVQEQVPGLLEDPGPDRVLRGAQDPDPPVAVLDDRLDRLRLDRRNSAQPGPSRRSAGSMPAFLGICQTVDGATMMPSPATSPWMRRYPHDSFSRA